MTAPASFAAIHTELGKTFAGLLLEPGDAGYDEARRVHNGLVDKHPALIARCRTVSDIVQAVQVAREHGLEVAVRGGGHNVAGRATIDHGLMIDLSLMKDIHVDPESGTAQAEGGVTWGELNRETQALGLATTGGIVSTTGIAGLTLGGGMGYLLGMHGLAADNLLSAVIVTADGRALTASADENPDLFWAIRGGGGNFGVAASLEYRVHPVGPTVTAGLAAHPFAQARDVLRFYREVTRSLPDEFVVHCALLNAPDGSGTKLVAPLLCHSGPPADGERAVRPVKEFGSPVLDVIGPMSYCQINSLIDADYPRGARNYWKSSFLTELSDDAIEAMMDSFARCPTTTRGCGFVLEHVHGAATRVPVTATPFPHRAEGYSLVVLAQWTDPAEDERCIAWARQSFAAMHAFRAPGAYVNYLDQDDAGDPVAAAYGANYQRLRELKRTYDPENFFHMNQNIRPQV
jgi:FAD/FMN-containing dehydrogenase